MTSGRSAALPGGPDTAADVLDLDGVPSTIPHALIRTAAARPDHPALVDGRGTLSYGALRTRAHALAAALVKAGMRKGDRVGIWLPNCNEWVVACSAVQMAGGVVIPLNTRYKATEVGHALNRAEVRFLIHADRFVGIDYRAMLGTIQAERLVRAIAVALKPDDRDELGAFIAEADGDARASAEVDRRLARLSGDDVSDIMFTSGTTGAPKGVVTTHGQNMRTYVEWVRATTMNADDRLLMIWPFCHCSGYKSGWLTAMIVGCTVFPEATLDIDRLVRRAIDERITFLPGPPTLFKALLDATVGKDRLVSLRVVGTGGTVIDPTLIRDIRSKLGAKVVYAGYGLTECCGTAAMIYADDPPEMVVASTGRAIAGVEISAMAPDGEILPPGTEGELVTRGYHVMRGYLDDPEGTAAAIDPNGWLHTGDLGHVDALGFVHVTGRAKDMYIVGGFNCYPAEIEHMLSAHPGVREVAVTGMPDERLGEVGCAFVVWDEAAGEPDAEGLIRWSRDVMANYKVPRVVRILPSLPRNAMGKIEKRRLTELAEPGKR